MPSGGKKSAIVIGSGIGGSAVAALLASKGWDVTVLEKLGVVGGRCCSWEKQGFTIDLGVHTFSQAGAGPLGEILRQCGVDSDEKVEWSYTRKPTQKLCYLGKTIEYPKGIAELGVNVEEYGALVKAIVSMPEDRIRELDHMGLKEFMDQYTKDPVIHNIFAYISILYFIAPYWRASAGEFIRSMKEQAIKRASGYPVGGCQVIPQSYLDVLTAKGGKVRTRAGVKSLVIEDGKATGVVLEGGETLKADLVISNADPQITVGLAGKEHFPEDYLKKVSDIEFSPGAFVMKFALDKVITDEKFLMLIAHPDPETYYGMIEDNQIPEEANLMVPVISNLSPGCAPPGKQLIIAGSFPAINPDEDAWEKAVMRSVKKLFPDIEEHLLFSERTSPADVNTLMGEGGGVIGLMQNVNQVADKRIRQETPLQNLYLVGAEAGGWGIGTELAANSALELAGKLAS